MALPARLLPFLVALLLLLPECHAGSKAFYVLFANQIDSPTWPHKVCQNGGLGPQGGECVDLTTYTDGAVIVSPQNITAGHIHKIRTAAPGAAVLAYWAFSLIPLKLPADRCPCCTGHVMGDLPGRNCTTTYPCGDGTFTEAIARDIPADFAANRIYSNGTREVICGYPGQAQIVFTANSSVAVATFVAKWVLPIGFDGVYLDGYLSPPLNKYQWPEGVDMDFDGDGKPENPTQVLMQHFAFAPVFVSTLRDLLGPNALLLANSGGALSDPNLNGLTIEMESCGDPKSCAAALIGQNLVAPNASRNLSIMWMTHSESMSPAEQCARVKEFQAEMPWVLEGTDFFDGSHVVCD